MEREAPQLMCESCRAYNRLDRVFCLHCNRRLVPPPAFSLSVDDFASPGDRSNLEALRATEPLPHLVEKFFVPSGERSGSWLSRHGSRIRPPSRLDALVRACGEVLGLRSLPVAYVAPVNQVNAFTAGRDESPLLVICSPVLDRLGYVEVEGLIAHELAHVKSKHVLYHTLAESLATGVQLASPLAATGVLTLPIRMLLLSWYRESEVSADRAALLVLGNYRAFESLMVRLMSSLPTGGEGGSLSELLQTHPNFDHRLRLAREYYGSDDYGRARMKIVAAADSGSLASVCKYCGLMVPRTEAFCAGCGLSRT